MPTLIWLLHACTHGDVCAICNGDVLHGTGKAKRLRLFREGVTKIRDGTVPDTKLWD